MRTGDSESPNAPATSLSTLWDTPSVPARLAHSIGRPFPDHILFHGVSGVNTTLVPFICRHGSALPTSTLPCRSRVQLPAWRTAPLATYRDRYDQGLISRSAPTFLESPPGQPGLGMVGSPPFSAGASRLCAGSNRKPARGPGGGVDPRHGGVTRNAENVFSSRCQLSRDTDLPRVACAWQRSRRRTFAKGRSSACPVK
jgi:hypothetical protein